MYQFEIDSFIRKVEAIATKHWGEMGGLAATSQADERINLKPGSVARSYKKYEVTERYKENATEKSRRAYDAMTTEHDKLLQKARAEEAEPTTADQIASVEAFFKTNPNADSIVNFYEANNANFTVAKLILSEAAKKRLPLPKPLALIVLDSFEAVNRTLNRLAYGVGGVPLSTHIEQLKRDLAGKSGLPTGVVSLYPGGGWSVGWE